MNKALLIPVNHVNNLRVISMCVIVGVLVAVAFGTSPATAHGGYAQININLNVYGSALGDNTNIVDVILETDVDNYQFTATGQTILSIAENENLVEMRVTITLDDNYADTAAKATSRTRVTAVLTDPDSVIRFDNLVGIIDAQQSREISDNGVYWTVIWKEDIVLIPYRLGFLLQAGTWDLDLEYEVFAILS